MANKNILQVFKSRLHIVTHIVCIFFPLKRIIIAYIILRFKKLNIYLTEHEFEMATGRSKT